MSKYIYKEIQYAKWMFFGILFSLIILISGTLFAAIASNTYTPLFLTICFLFVLVPLVSYERVIVISIDNIHITIKRMFGLIKNEIKIKDIQSYEIKSYGSSRELYEYKENNVTTYIVYDNRYFIKTKIKGKAIKLNTQKGNYLIGTQNPERIIEILKTLTGSEKELQSF